MVEAVRRDERMLGAVHYAAQSEAGAGNLRFRRSLFIVRDVKKGELFTPDNIRSIRPGDGLPVRYYEESIGKRAARDSERGTPLSWDIIETDA
jgi:sialic acid synthase SpsE